MSSRIEVSEEVDGRAAWVVVAAAFVSMFTVFGVAYSFGSFFGPMAKEFGASRSATSAVFSITAFVYFTLGMFSGRAVDRLGPKPVLVAGAVGLSVGLFLTSLVDSLWLGYVTYGAGVGVAVACGYVPMVAVVGGWFVRRRAAALGIAVSGIGMGTLVGAPAAASLIDELGWRTTYRVLAVVGGVALLLCALVARRPPMPLAPAVSNAAVSNAAEDAAAGSPASAARSPEFVRLYLSGLLLSLALFLVFIFLTPYAEEHDIRKTPAAALVGIVGAASVVGRLALGAVADRLGAVRAYKGSFLAIAASYPLWLFSTGYPGLVAFAVVFGVAYGGFIALSPAVMAHLFGTATMGRLVGLLYTSAGIGALVGPPLAGLTVDKTGSYRWGIGAAMALAAAGWLVLLPLGRSAISTGTVPVEMAEGGG